MLKFKWLVVFALLLVIVQPSFADNRAKLLGIWKIVSWESEIQATGERRPFFGKNPTGYIIFTPEGRFMGILTGEGRKVPKTDQDRAELFKSVFAYTGIYRLEGDKFITKVDVSWNPAWVGTEQVRFFRFDGGRLQIISAWAPSPVQPERGNVGEYLLLSGRINAERQDYQILFFCFFYPVSSIVKVVKSAISLLVS